MDGRMLRAFWNQDAKSDSGFSFVEFLMATGVVALGLTAFSITFQKQHFQIRATSDYDDVSQVVQKALQARLSDACPFEGLGITSTLPSTHETYTGIESVLRAKWGRNASVSRLRIAPDQNFSTSVRVQTAKLHFEAAVSLSSQTRSVVTRIPFMSLVRSNTIVGCTPGIVISPAWEQAGIARSQLGTRPNVIQNLGMAQILTFCSEAISKAVLGGASGGGGAGTNCGGLVSNAPQNLMGGQVQGGPQIDGDGPLLTNYLVDAQ